MRDYRYWYGWSGILLVVYFDVVREWLWLRWMAHRLRREIKPIGGKSCR